MEYYVLFDSNLYVVKEEVYIDDNVTVIAGPFNKFIDAYKVRCWFLDNEL